jgi:hypothetical protein
VKGGSTVIAFAKDPTGYMWELIQRPQTQEPLCQVRRTPDRLSAHAYVCGLEKGEGGGAHPGAMSGLN